MLLSIAPSQRKKGPILIIAYVICVLARMPLFEGTPFIPKRSTHNNVSFFLINLTSWFRKPTENHIARRIALKAYELAKDIDDVNSALSWMIRLDYYVRDTEPGTLDLVIECRKRQIKIVPSVIKKHKKEYPSLNLGKYEGYTRYVSHWKKIVIMKR